MELGSSRFVWRRDEVVQTAQQFTLLLLLFDRVGRGVGAAGAAGLGAAGLVAACRGVLRQPWGARYWSDNTDGATRSVRQLSI